MMKRLLPVALFFPLVVQAQQVRDSIITVTANRTSTIAPDRVLAVIVVEGTAETPADANARLDTKTKAIQEALRSMGAAVTVDRPIPYGVSLAQNPGGYPINPAQPTYVSRSLLRIQISRMDQMGQGIAAVIAAGAASVTGMTFESSAIDSVRRDKMAEVLAIARADAQALAAALGGKLGALVDVSSSSNPQNIFGPSQIVLDQRFGGGQAAPPTISMSTNVTLRYRLTR